LAGFWEAVSSPEAQAINSETLLKMVDHHQKEANKDSGFFLDSITVIHNGYVVGEVYPDPNFPRDQLHVLHSANKHII
jgi:hypothetical protein